MKLCPQVNFFIPSRVPQIPAFVTGTYSLFSNATQPRSALKDRPLPPLLSCHQTGHEEPPLSRSKAVHLESSPSPREGRGRGRAGVAPRAPCHSPNAGLRGAARAARRRQVLSRLRRVLPHGLPGGYVRARASRLCRRVTWPAPCAEAARRPGQMSPSPRPRGSCSQGCVSGRFRHFTGSFWFLASPWLSPRPGLLNLLPTGGCGATWTVSRHTHQEVRLGQGHQGDRLHAGTSKHPFWKRFLVFIPPPAPETEAQLPGSAGRPPSTHPSASGQSGQLCALHPSSRTK